MPRERSPFDSGLPRMAEFEPPAEEKRSAKDLVLERIDTLEEKVQLLWDSYRDLQRGWVDFVREKRQKRKKGETPPSSVHLLAPDNPLSQEFHGMPEFQKQHRRLRALWEDEAVRARWQTAMQAHAEQWAAVNGRWESYAALHRENSELDQHYDVLRQEQFNERGIPPARRRRTLADELAALEAETQELRGKVEALTSENPDLAAKILASQLEERRRELHSKEGFMWFGSRRAAYEAIEARVSEKDTLRIILLEGQAGTGKTSFVRALARKFTGKDPVEVTIKVKTKVDRQLMADETLDRAHPTVYRPVLQAITGKARPEDMPAHNGRVAFTDELNKGDNDEVGDLATKLDGMKVGGKTRYEELGANPDDRVQPHALVVAAQNPAGARFLNRTKFTPEVQRKLDIIQLDYFTQTPENPELYEAFLVSLMDQDGRVQARREELAPAWVPESIKNTAGQEIGTKDKLVTQPNQGGALWRISEMLHQSYENLYKRKNVLTDANPDAHLQGRVLPPGDVMNWLQSYRKEMKKGASLEAYLSQKFKDWIDSSFTADHDQPDKQLYLALAEKYGLVKKVGGEFQSLPPAKVAMDMLTQRDIAEMSPRVPRKMISKETEIHPPNLTRAVMDWTAPDGTVHRRVEVRYEPLANPRRYRRPDDPPDAPAYIMLGTIKECARVPELVGQLYLKKAD